VRVLLLVHAKCISGQYELARRRVDAALAATGPAATKLDHHQSRLTRRQPETVGPNWTPPDAPPGPGADLPRDGLDL
jgi:hypothetical protein